MNSGYRLLAVDDHSLTLDGLAAMLKSFPEVAQVYIAKNAEEALNCIRTNAIDLALIDISIGEDDGRALFKQIKELRPGIRCIALSSFAHPKLVDQCLQMGFSSYVIKTASSAELMNTISCVLEGKENSDTHYGTKTAVPTLLAPKALLSERELEILKRLAKGQSSKMIADSLNISTKTVENHRTNLILKMEVSNVAELIVKGISLGYVRF
jgi:DNA-binding NarL/FixJ family response regulator